MNVLRKHYRAELRPRGSGKWVSLIAKASWTASASAGPSQYTKFRTAKAARKEAVNHRRVVAAIQIVEVREAALEWDECDNN